MATVNDIVTRAYRKIGIVAHDEAMTSDQGASGLSAFNEMLSAWALDGITITYSDLALTDTFPLADKYREGVIYLLASRITPEFAMPVGFDPSDFFRKIQASYMAISAATIPSPLLNTPSQRSVTEEF